MVHANGLVAAGPDGFEAMMTETGFAFIEAGALRSPLRIDLDLARVPPDLAGAGSRDVGGEPVRFEVRELGGGFGGTEYELVAVRAMNGRHVVLTAFDQTEARPGFDAAWAMLEHATVR